MTDHKPLITLFSEKKAVSSQASGKIQRWSLTLGIYEYTISFKPTSAHGNADALSRLPLPVQPAQTPEPMETVLLMKQLASSPVTAQHIELGLEEMHCFLMCYSLYKMVGQKLLMRIH